MKMKEGGEKKWLRGQGHRVVWRRWIVKHTDRFEEKNPKTRVCKGMMLGDRGCGVERTVVSVGKGEA